MARGGPKLLGSGGPSSSARQAVRDAAFDLSADAEWEADRVGRREPARRSAPPFDPTRRDPQLADAKTRAERRRAERPPHLLSQTNRGLRMILTATVLVVFASWGATVANEYLEYLKIQELAKGDPDALRVMCAVNPPTERDLGMMQLCETAARAAPAVAAQ